jgi:hypothetical protein
MRLIEKLRVALLHLTFITLLLTIIQGCATDAINTPEETDRSANLKASGDSAEDLLTNTNFDDIVIQIAYVSGFAPSDLALSDLQEFLLNRTFKNSIRFEYLPLPATGKDQITLQQIADLEKDNRTLYNDGRTLAVYIFFSDAPSDTDEPQNNTYTLGAVYRNTSMVLYASTIRFLASKVSGITTADAEAATLNHEFGHLLGLVNMGVSPVNNHEDPEAKNHCSEDTCLMRASLEFTTGMAKAMLDRKAKNLRAVPDLGPECLRDLKAAGGR